MEIVSKSYQKEIIRRIVEMNQQNSFCVIGNLIDHWLYPDIYIDLLSENECPVYIKKTYFDQITDEQGWSGINLLVSKINDQFLELVVLINKLKDDDYIHFSGNFDIKKLGNEITEIVDGEKVKTEYISLTFEDKSVIKSLFHFSKKRIKSTEKLAKYVADNYQTPDEIYNVKKKRREKQLYYISTISLLLTALGMILSSVWEFYKLGQTQKIEITNDKLKVETNCCDTSIDVDKNLLYDNLYFEFDSSGILPSSTFHLETIFQILSSKPQLNIEIIGNCDSIGSNEYNNKLSLKRAQSVANELTKKGLNVNRIKIIGNGENEPISDDKEYYGRWKNRRVELKIK